VIEKVDERPVGDGTTTSGGARICRFSWWTGFLQ
jgi:hypothetical protein